MCNVMDRMTYLRCATCHQLKPTIEFSPLEGVDEDLRGLYSDSCTLCLAEGGLAEGGLAGLASPPPVLGPFQPRDGETPPARASRRYALKQRCLAQWRRTKESGVQLAKACQVCTKVKVVEEFDVDLSQPDCLTSICSLCLREQEAREAEWQAANKAFNRGDLDPGENIVAKVDRELAKILAAEDQAELRK